MFKPISGHTKYGWMVGLAVFIFALTHDSAIYTWFLWLIWMYVCCRPLMLPNLKETDKHKADGSMKMKLHTAGGYVVASVLCGFWGFFFHYLVYGKVW